MNSSKDIPDNPQGQNMREFGFDMGLSLGLILLIIILTYASYVCRTRVLHHHHDVSHGSSSTASTATDTTENSFIAATERAAGLDKASLVGYPKPLYSEAKIHRHGDSAAGGCCSICLADYEDGDVLRSLAECGHVFHLRCIGPWLRIHPTCPNCRNSPLPTPQPTPTAEVVPLATRPI